MSANAMANGTKPKRKESYLAGAGNTLRGKPAKDVKRRFVLYSGEVKLVSRLTAFRRFCSLLCEHLPAIKEGDVVELHKPSESLTGDAEVMDVKHIACGDGSHKSALVVRQTGTPDRDGEAKHEDAASASGERDSELQKGNTA